MIYDIAELEPAIERVRYDRLTDDSFPPAVIQELLEIKRKFAAGRDGRDWRFQRWLVERCGLDRVDMRTLAMQLYDEEDGEEAAPMTGPHHNARESGWFTEIVETHGTRYRVHLTLYNRPMAVEREVERRDGSRHFRLHWGGRSGAWAFGPSAEGTISGEVIDRAIAAKVATEHNRIAWPVAGSE
jgi:hypothetical protein